MSEENAMVPQDQGSPEPAVMPEVGSEQGAEQTATETNAADEQPSEEQAQPEGEQQSDEQPEEKKTPWFVTRLQRQREQLEAERNRRQELEAMLSARGGEQPQGEQGETQRVPASEVERRAQQLAEQRIQAQQFNESCNRAHDAGVKEFPDFKDALQNLGMLGVLQQPDVLRTVMEAAGDDAHKALHFLGKNPDEAERILSLPPIRQAAAIARAIAAPAKPPPKPSQAPPPIRPINGTARVDPDESRMSIDEWVKKHPLPSRT